MVFVSFVKETLINKIEDYIYLHPQHEEEVIYNTHRYRGQYGMVITKKLYNKVKGSNL